MKQIWNCSKCDKPQIVDDIMSKVEAQLSKKSSIKKQGLFDPNTPAAVAIQARIDEYAADPHMKDNTMCACRYG